MDVRVWVVRGAILSVAASSVLVAGAGAAGANITGPCDGTATIKNVTYTPANDTPGNPILVPKEEGIEIPWQATSGLAIHNHHGEISIRIGPFLVKIEDWSGENARDQVSQEGVYSLDEFFELVPGTIVGIYRVEGFHQGDEARCEGFVYVKFEGNPLTTPLGAGAMILSLFALIGLVLSGRARVVGP